jgi:dienelactone hydrolase
MDCFGGRRMLIGVVVLVLATGCGAADGTADRDRGADGTTCGLAAITIPDGARCGSDDCAIRCAHRTVTFTTGVDHVEEREVHWQVPVGTAPDGGWPVVFHFQGSLYSAELSFKAAVTSPFGAYHQTRAIASLLADGYAVVAPEVRGDGSTFWQTNIPPYSTAFSTADDHALMERLFTAIEDGTFGRLDPSRLHATGISSGGYMTSRVGITWPHRFASLAIQSASYATCGGPLCEIPTDLPTTHPPTLFLHGERDTIVPVATMRAYAAALRESGIPTEVVTDPAAGHEWIDAAPASIPDWFDAHR